MQPAQISPQAEEDQSTQATAEEAVVGQTPEPQPAEQPVAEAPAGDSEPTEAAAPAQTANLDQMINLCIEKEASDMHFREGGRVSLRVGGKLIFVENLEPLSKEQADAIVSLLTSSKAEREKLESNRELDFSYTHSNGVNFRVNLFYQQGKLAGVMRMISKHIPTMDELGIPEVMKQYLGLKEGLILVCGAAGSGKSTTIHAMLEHINQNFVQHVLTLENPIEYVFDGKQSMFTQREMGKDALSVQDALLSATREDANVVMVNEISNYETLDRILDLVETGHLVIAASQTRDVTQTLERLVSSYPKDLVNQVQERLAANLTAVMAQDLVERQDEPGLIALFELMTMNESVRNIIRRGNFVQIKTAIRSAQAEGMITMDAYASQLAERAVISQEQLNEYIQRES